MLLQLYYNELITDHTIIEGQPSTRIFSQGKEHMLVIYVYVCVYIYIYIYCQTHVYQHMSLRDSGMKHQRLTVMQACVCAHLLLTMVMLMTTMMASCMSILHLMMAVPMAVCR